MATSYAQWSVSDLEKEKARIEKAIEKSGRDKSRVRAQLNAIAKKNGYELADLVESDEVTEKPATGKKKAASKKAVGKKVSKAKGRKIPPKYAHPTDKGRTWSGRGRTPLWVVEFEKQGTSRDDLLIG